MSADLKASSNVMELPGLPADLVQKGWKLFMRDSRAPYIAENEELDLSTGGYPSKDEAIDKAVEMATEEEERQAIAGDGAVLVEEPVVKIEPGRQTLPVHSIRTDGGTQPRSALDMIVVGDYKDAMLNGAEFPHVDVFFDGKDVWLADGFHRLQARKEAGVESGATVKFGVIGAEVRLGTKRDALLYALGANTTHGLRRSRDDKRRAVTMMLEDGEWSKFSDSAIAMKVNVSQPFVSKLRRELTSQNVLSEQQVRVGADGVSRDISNIGKAVEEDDRQRSLVDDSGSGDTPAAAADAPQVKEHQWQKLSLVTEPGGYDKYWCALCGATGKRWGVSWPPALDENQPADCPAAAADVAAPKVVTEAPLHHGDLDEADENRNTAWTSEGIVELLNRHGGVLMRMQLEDMGVSYAAIHSALAEGVIVQPETGKFTLPDHKPQPSASADPAPRATAPAPKPKPSIDELLKGRGLSISLVWIPGVKGKVNVTVNAGKKPEEATRRLIDSDQVRGLPEVVQQMIVEQLSGSKPAATSSARLVKKAKPAKKVRKPKSTPRAPAKKKPAAKKKAAKGRKR